MYNAKRSALLLCLLRTFETATSASQELLRTEHHRTKATSRAAEAAEVADLAAETAQEVALFAEELAKAAHETSEAAIETVRSASVQRDKAKHSINDVSRRHVHKKDILQNQPLEEIVIDDPVSVTVVTPSFLELDDGAQVADNSDVVSSLPSETDRPQHLKRFMIHRHGPDPVGIPSNLLFYSKVKLLGFGEHQLAEDAQAVMLRRNIIHTISSMRNVKPSNVYYWDDEDCQYGLGRLEEHGVVGASELAHEFVQEQSNARNELCRLAMLYLYGGYYYDPAVLAVADIQKFVSADTTFAAVVSSQGGSLLPGFAASVKEHPVITRSLKALCIMHHRSPEEQAELRSKMGDLLSDAYRTWSGVSDKPSKVVHGNGHVSQFFAEFPISSLDARYGVSLLGQSGGSCDYAVVSRDVEAVLMYSRVYDYTFQTPCREQLFQLLSATSTLL